MYVHHYCSLFCIFLLIRILYVSLCMLALYTDRQKNQMFFPSMTNCTISLCIISLVILLYIFVCWLPMTVFRQQKTGTLAHKSNNLLNKRRSYSRNPDIGMGRYCGELQAKVGQWLCDALAVKQMSLRFAFIYSTSLMALFRLTS